MSKIEALRRHVMRLYNELLPQPLADIQAREEAERERLRRMLRRAR